MTTSLGMKSAAVSTMKPMLGASRPREPVRMALAMVWTSSLASVRMIWAHRGQKVHQTNVASFTAMRAWNSDTGNGLEVFSSTCHSVLGSLRMGTPRKTDSEKSPSLGMKLAAVSTKKPMLGASSRERALAMASRSPRAHLSARCRLFIIYFWLFTAPFAYLCSKFPKNALSLCYY